MASCFRRFSSWTRRFFGDTTPRNVNVRGAMGKHFVELEARCVPATFVVTNILDNQADVVGGMSLREAIYAANGNPGFDKIVFNIPRSPSLPTLPNDPTENYYPIVLASTLPDLTDPAGAMIDATTQPRNNVTGTRPIVQLLPDPNPGAFPGQKGAFLISGGNNTIRGLVITGFPGSAINLTSENAKNNTLVGNWINTDITGTRSWNEDPIILTARPPGTPPELTNTGPNANKFPLFVLGGITLSDGANNNTIGGIIDKAGQPLANAGGEVLGTGATISRFNSKGVLTDTGIPITPDINRNIISGTPEFKKSYFNYVWALDGSTKVRSDDVAGAGVGPGIRIMDPGTSNNLVQGNFIGTDVTGNLAIPNFNGIEILNSATSNYIGNPNTNFVGDPVQAGVGNLIRFNINDGIRNALVPAPSQINPPPPVPGPPPPWQEGEDGQTSTAPGPFGPSRANGLAIVPFLDEMNPNYFKGSSPIGPDILTVVATARTFDPNSTTTTPDGIVNQTSGIEAQVGTKVRITGSGLLSTSSVTFNASPTATPNPQTVPAKFTVIDDSNVDVIIPAGAVTPPPGIPGVNLFTPAGRTTNLDAGFAVNILPSPPTQIEIVSTFNPSSGVAGSIVSVFGAGFTGTQNVSIGGVLATKFTVLPGGNQIDIVVPTGAQSGPITIFTPGGSASTTRDFRVESQPPPVITTINKASALPGEEVILTGVNFTGAYLIRFNFAGGVSGFSTTNFTVDSPTQIRVKVPVLATASIGPIQVVTNDGFGVSNSTLRIDTPPAPTISGLSLTSGPIGSFVTITGSNFTSATRVTFSGIDAFKFTVVSPNQIKAVVPFGLPVGLASPVRVVSNGGTTAPTNTFTITASLAPTVDPIPFGIRNNFVVVNGTNLSGTTKVLFGHPVTGINAVSFEVLSDTQIRVQIPPDVASSGPFFLYTAYNTQNPLEGPAQSTYTVAANVIPQINSGRQSDPISGIAGSTVTLRGTGFLGTQDVLFLKSGGGTVSANDLTIVSDAEITFKVPVLAITGPITVVSPGVPDPNTPFSPVNQPQITSVPFTLLASPAPVISNFFPASAPVGTILTLSGTGFLGTVQVKFGNGIADEYTIESDNVIKVRVPLLAETAPISVQTVGGTAFSSTSFTLVDSPVPTILHSTPQAPRNTQITIAGTALAGTTKVMFNDLPSQFTVINDSLITAVVPLGAGPGEIRVFTPGGNVASPTPFALSNVQLPSMGSLVGDDVVPVGGHFLINGINLQGVLAVGLEDLATGTIITTDFDFADDGQGNFIIARVPEMAAGQYRINVFASNKNNQDNWNFPALLSPPQSGTNFDNSWDSATNIIGTVFEYGELLTVLPNARPTVTGVSANDGVITRGAPIYVKGSGFTGASRIQLSTVDPVTGKTTLLQDIYNDFKIAADFDKTIHGDEFLAFDGVTRYRVLSDNEILMTLPTNFGDGVSSLDDVIVTVFTPNNLARFQLTDDPTDGNAVLAASMDDLPSMQTDAKAQMDILATQALTFTSTGDGAFYGSTVTLTATSGDFFGVTSLTASAKDAFGKNAPLGTDAAHHPFPLSNPTPFRDFTTNFVRFVHDPDLFFQNFQIVPGTNGTVAKAVIPTGFAKIPDAEVAVPPGAPPVPVPPPGALLTWTAKNSVGPSVAKDILLARAAAPTTISIAPEVAGQFNRTFVIQGNTSIIGTSSIDIAGVGSISRDAVQAKVIGQTVQLRFVMPAPAFYSGAWPSGSVTLNTADGNATGTFTPAAQKIPQIFSLDFQSEGVDNRFQANRVFDNGVIITRDPTTGFVTGVTPKPQATKATDGNLGIDFVTMNPNHAPGFPFDFGYARIDQGPPNAPPAGNQGKGGIQDGLLDSFSLPSAISALPNDPNFANIALPSGLLFSPGQNTFNNTQYGRYFGPNNLQNFPLLQVVSSSIDRTTFSTALLGKPFRSYRIDYYYNPGIDNTLTDPALDPFLSSTSPVNFIGSRFDDQDATARKTTNIGSGQIYLGSKVITTDGQGDGGVSFVIYKRLPTDPNDPNSIPALQPGEFQLPNNTPLVPSVIDPITGNVTFRAGVVTATATDLTAPGPNGPILTAGPDGTSRFSFFKRVDTPTGTITGSVIIDKNANGVIDPGEQGLGGSTVSLFVQRDDGTYAAVPNATFPITDEGSFFFGPGSPGTGNYGLPNGTHKLALTLPTGQTKYFYEIPSDGVLNPIIIGGETVPNQNFLVTTTPTGNPPTISPIASVNVNPGDLVGPIAFTVGDIETPADQLVVTAVSSNGAFIPDASIVLGGTGPNRTVTIQLPAGVSNSSTITITVTDGSLLTAQTSFVVTAGIPPANTPPTITPIANQTGTSGGTVGPITYTIGDLETPPNSLNLTYISTNPGLVPVANIVGGGTGADRNLTITSVPGVFGATTITVVVTDAGGLSNQTSFVFEVPPPPGTAPSLLVVGSDAGRVAQVNVYSPNGTFRYTLTPYGDGFTGGVRVATGDVTGDGNADVITAPGIGIPGLVKIYDGVTGEFINQYLPYGEAFKGGVYVVTGDIDGDGIRDLITGTGKGGGPRVRVVQGGLSGGTMPLVGLADFFPYESSFRGGVLVAAGDVNLDGIDDIVTGTGVTGGPRVRVLDGTQLSSTPGVGTIYDFFAYDNRFRGGVFASVGDVDGDGIPEILTGTGFGGGAAVKIFKQSDLAGNVAQPLASKSFFAYDPSFNGGVRVDVIDGNGDGIADIVTAPGAGVGPDVRVVNYATLQDIYRIQAFDATFKGGLFVGGNLD